ncbi:hypothetical protein AAFF_G00172530 [Aldrovandia affinis]|uniref:Sushi domain-containing protein n=1 Tax=Aldrovandia affinis TaxID=143900 RepID=A0AAD7SZZ0_9TELE|nr:hypothetical protein AAFF_G00172530 [Aldrovandia affinis]
MSSHIIRFFVLLLSLTKNRHHGVVCARVVDSCPPPPQKDKTKPFHQTQSYQEDQKYRYSCIEGYVRRAGTSSLIQCKRNAGTLLEWDDTNRPTSIVCIPDPKMKKPPEVTETVEEEKKTSTSTVQPSSVATTTGDNNMEGPSRMTHDVTLPVGMVIAVIGVILLVSLTMVALKLKNPAAWRRFRLQLARREEQIPMQPIELHHPQDDRYVPVVQQAQ